MLSPHTSYPVLEMAASGGVTVTNIFATKTKARLEAMSANIIAVPATEEGFTRGLIDAAARVARGVDIAAALNLPGTWRESLSGTAERMAAMFRAEVGAA
jgi:protein gp37